MKKILTFCMVILLHFFMPFDMIFGQQDRSYKSVPKLSSDIKVISKDSTQQFFVKINGSSNTVKINDKLMASTTDSINSNNSIYVDGEGNTVTIIQNKNKLEVNIRQEGGNNRVQISQGK